MEAEDLFCGYCGKQLFSINEIDLGKCNTCLKSKKEIVKENNFLCWSCGKIIITMNEIAQGICHNCKAAIIRKLR